MKICLDCEQKFEDKFFRCKRCTQILMSEGWLNSPRETKSPIKIVEIAQILGKESESGWLSSFESQLVNVKSKTGDAVKAFAEPVFTMHLQNKIMSENEAANVIKTLSMFSFAWAATCFAIGMESGKENLKDGQVFTYIIYITDAFANYFLQYLWNLHNRKIISADYYQKFTGGFLLSCTYNALLAEKAGYLESFKVDDYKSDILFSLNQIINKR